MTGWAWSYLYRTVMSNELVFHGLTPESQIHKVLHKVVVDHLELPRQHPPRVDVACIRLNGFIVPQDLGCGCGRHGSQEQAVPHTMPRWGRG